MVPELFKDLYPVMHSFQLLRFQVVHALFALLGHSNQADLAQYGKVLRDSRLRKPQHYNQSSNSQGPAPRKQFDNLSPTGLGDGVEYVGCSRRSWHAPIIFAYANMSSQDSVARTGDVLCLTASQRLQLENRAKGVRKAVSSASGVFLMNKADSLPYRATLEEYQQQAEALFNALKSADEAAAWRFKWLHPRFRGQSVTDVRAATLDVTDAQMVVAREYSFESWGDLAEFAATVRCDGAVDRFETAVEAVISGDTAALRSMLSENPELVRARSTRRHHATLLHYVGANGVESGRQKTPANAVEVVKILLDAGVEVDALADMYDNKCTTMSMLVSSCHPAEAGLQATLAETLLDYGAASDGAGSAWQSAVMTALAFGYLNTAETLARRGVPLNHLGTVAGLGRLEATARLLPVADSQSRQIALALAAQHGHADVVRLLLDAGEDPSRYNPDGCHAHSTPLHQAVCYDHADVVRLLVERGARLDIRDKVYRGTPLDWAIHCGRTSLAEYLREQGGQTM